MELKYGLEGCELSEITKIGGTVKLRFFDPGKQRKIFMSFEGVIFETPSVFLPNRVSRMEYSSILGFKAMSQLQHMNRNPHSYKQLLLVLGPHHAEYKNEIICAFQDYQMRAQTI
ncbi:hypothetical protein MTO98_16130 [Mucilaginibacter sp. SMC90]|uniref:hypothetical protein n=1 Tax=Mucilaginibacter sp. SMC90 TaxID=2929803 RepID=UPI001FB516D1|nr:hypothetical protein [Mucilaginibacter sp. SMC90]UOE52606.1 hypothetical protein MTO98_16130 [Mucilaginibacter sp. SMC90]